MEGTMRQAPRAAEEGPRILPDGPVFRGDVTNDKGSPGTDGRPPKQPSPISVRRDGTHGNNPLDDDDDDDNEHHPEGNERGGTGGGGGPCIAREQSSG
mmetsp:Transcript_30351/g.71574  ORF Transcript_30351/g.71574 Transcript_30351/m.71574 type:complete len:98 (-) Transcript_30351:759-1052(-)